MKNVFCGISALLFCLLSVSGFSQDPKEIIRLSEEKFKGKESAFMEMSIEIIRPKWSREMALKSWSKGDDYSLMVLTSPKRDAGTAFLKRKKEVWNWVPSIERTIKLPPSMMMQSWMGTDFTNDDLVRSSSNVDDYTHEIKQDSTIDGRLCFKLELTPKPDAAVVWGKETLFIDKKDFILLKSEMYDEDGYLINIIQYSDIKTFGSVLLASKMELIPVEEEGNKTIIYIQNITFDLSIEESFFTTQNMKKIK